MKHSKLLLYVLPFFLMSLSNTRQEKSVHFRANKDYALFFAVKDYDYDSWVDLQNPIKDSKAIAQELQDKYGFTTEVVPNPTQTDILNKLREYSQKQYDQDAQLFIFFSGHGHFDELTTEGFFIPKDGKSSSQDVNGTTWISHDRLQTRVASIPCRHILLSIDACFSGTFDRRIALGRNEDQIVAYVEQGLKYKSRLYLTSGGKEYTSDGTEHSPFTRGLLAALRLDENDLITFPELVSKIQYVKPVPRFGEFEGNEAGGNFYFIGKNANIPSENQPFNRPTTKNEIISDPATKVKVPDLIFVKGGTFQMGDVMSDNEYPSEIPVHNVTLSNFFIGKYEVTFAEFDRFCEATDTDKPPSAGWGRGERPVINIRWLDAIDYCIWLSKEHKYRPVYTRNGDNVIADWTADGYRLPTEAEWEYAARSGGTNVRFGNGKNIADPKEINFNSSIKDKKTYSLTGDYPGKTLPVGSMGSPNILGLHDMSGNVYEWCWDCFKDYSDIPQVDPHDETINCSKIVIRGGSAANTPRRVRVAHRDSESPTSRKDFLGFRIARLAP